MDVAEETSESDDEGESANSIDAVVGLQNKFAELEKLIQKSDDSLAEGAQG